MKGFPKISQRWHLYFVNFSHVTSFFAILPMLPYLNIELDIKGFNYALTFSGYYLTQLFGFIYFGSVSDRIGRRNSLIISLLCLTICNFICFTTKNIYVYIAMRCVTGLFDCVVSITQAYITDISSERDRASCLARLEAVMNAGQCVGPLIAGIVSTVSVRYSIYFGIGVECMGFIYSVFFLPESVESVLEKKKLLKTFSMVKQANRRGMNEDLLKEATQEADEIQKEFLRTLQKEQKTRQQNSHLIINYLIVIAIICEFCNKFVFSVFDTVVCQHGEAKHHLTPLEFSLLSTVGSAINIVQTGFLFKWFIDVKGLSIPTVGSLAGAVGAAACIILIYGNKVWYYIGATLIIVGYGFYAPAESNESSHGKALSLAHVGGQLAHIISPVLLEQLYSQQTELPFFITLIPSIILVIVMLMCDYLPGGRLAGQVSLAASLEHDAKMEIMNEDNEFETEFLGGTEGGGGSKSDKKRNNRLNITQQLTTIQSQEEQQSYPDYSENLAPTMALRMSSTRNMGPGWDDNMEI